MSSEKIYAPHQRIHRPKPKKNKGNESNLSQVKGINPPPIQIRKNSSPSASIPKKAPKPAKKETVGPGHYAAGFRSQGLWIAEKTKAGKYQILQKQLPEADYAEARKRLMQLNNNGRDPKQKDEARLKREEEGRARAQALKGPKW